MNTLRLETALKPGDLKITGVPSLVEWALESSPVATLFIAPDETILHWNQKAAENLIPALSVRANPNRHDAVLRAQG